MSSIIHVIWLRNKQTNQPVASITSEPRKLGLPETRTSLGPRLGNHLNPFPDQSWTHGASFSLRLTRELEDDAMAIPRGKAKEHGTPQQERR
jgi:hypothetical protein